MPAMPLFFLSRIRCRMRPLVLSPPLGFRLSRSVFAVGMLPLSLGLRVGTTLSRVKLSIRSSG
eukprot:5257820-Pyramimonas_sp.AAC.2